MSLYDSNLIIHEDHKISASENSHKLNLINLNNLDSLNNNSNIN